MDDPWRPYVDGDPACQLQHVPLDATTPPRAPAVLISFPGALSLLHFASASSAANRQLRPGVPRRFRLSQPAKSFARASSTSASPLWPLSSAGKAALPSSELFSLAALAAVSPELTGDVARPPCSTISSHFFLELPLDPLMLGMNLNRIGIG